VLVSPLLYDSGAGTLGGPTLPPKKSTKRDGREGNFHPRKNRLRAGLSSEGAHSRLAVIAVIRKGHPQGNDKAKAAYSTVRHK
jgi:hypothetical protein